MYTENTILLADLKKCLQLTFLLGLIEEEWLSSYVSYLLNFNMKYYQWIRKFLEKELAFTDKIPVVQWISAVQFSHSVVSDSLRPHDCSTPGFPIYHQFPEPIQTHVHCVGDAIQPSHPLSSHSPPSFNLSQYQGLFQWVSSSHQVAKVLEFQL